MAFSSSNITYSSRTRWMEASLTSCPPLAASKSSAGQAGTTKGSNFLSTGNLQTARRSSPHRQINCTVIANAAASISGLLGRLSGRNKLQVRGPIYSFHTTQTNQNQILPPGGLETTAPNTLLEIALAIPADWIRGWNG